jgi:glycosyltransferase involved in cell wall biosynthesis
VAEVVRAHSQHFVQCGHDVTIATAFDATRPRKQGSQPAVVEFRVEGVGNLRHPYRGEIEQYQEFIRQWEGDFILCHCWQCWTTDLAVPVFPKSNAIKVLISHGFGAHRYPKLARFPRGLITWLAWQPYVWRAVHIMKQFDHVVFLTNVVNRVVYYDHWLAERHHLKNTSVIPTGIHVEEFSGKSPDFRSLFGIGSRHMVLSLSNYDPFKNQLMAIKAFSRANVKDSVLVVVGKMFNDYSDLLRAWCEKNGETGRVLFLEKLDRSTIRAAYRAADLFVCSSLWESGPLVLLEAMAAETPFVSVDVGFAAQLSGGVVVQSEETMGQAIRELLNDEPLRRKLAKLGHAAGESNHDWKKIMPKYDALLKSLIKRPQELK